MKTVSEEIRSFVLELYTEESYRETPGFISVADARYNIEEMKKEGWEDLPSDLTAETYAEIWNTEVRTQKIAELIEENEYVHLNDCYLVNTYNLGIKTSNPDFMPVLFLDDPDMCLLGDNRSPLEIMELYDRSRKTFRLTDNYFYYDSEKNELVSSSRPFAEGKLDADEIARYCVEHDDDLDDDDIRKILDTKGE